MEDAPVSNIRETSRNTLKLSRRFHRDEENDFRRSVPSFNITPENIEDIVNRLKTRSSVSVTELQTLKNGLMEDEKYIEAVLNVNGALRGLVRELTGREVQKQCAAAGCLCNLALGDSRAATAVVKSAGPYLVTAMGSLSTELAVTCIWALGNLAGSGPKASSLLIAQGALPKLCEALSSANEELSDAAVYALTHFTYQMKDDLSTDHLSKILEALTQTTFNVSTSQLLFILCCHQDFDRSLPGNYLQRILQESQLSIQSHITYCKTNCNEDCKLIHLIRSLSNVSLNDSVFSLFVDSFKNLVSELKAMILKEDRLAESVLWLLGNTYKFCGDHEFFNRILKTM